MSLSENLDFLIQKYGEENGVALINGEDYQIINDDGAISLRWYNTLTRPTDQQLRTLLNDIENIKRQKKKKKILEQLKNSDYFPIFKVIFEKLNIDVNDIEFN